MLKPPPPSRRPPTAPRSAAPVRLPPSRPAPTAGTAEEADWSFVYPPSTSTACTTARRGHEKELSCSQYHFSNLVSSSRLGTRVVEDGELLEPPEETKTELDRFIYFTLRPTRAPQPPCEDTAQQEDEDGPSRSVGPSLGEKSISIHLPPKSSSPAAADMNAVPAAAAASADLSSSKGELRIMSGYVKLDRVGKVKKYLPMKKRWCILNPWLGCLFYWPSKEDRRKGKTVAKCLEGITGFTQQKKQKKQSYILQFGSRKPKAVRLVGMSVNDQWGWLQALKFIQETSNAGNDMDKLLSPLRNVNAPSLTVQKVESDGTTPVSGTPESSRSRGLSLDDILVPIPRESTLVVRKKKEEERLQEIRNIFQQEWNKARPVVPRGSHSSQASHHHARLSI